MNPEFPNVYTARELLAMTEFPRRPETEVQLYIIQAGEFVKIGIARDPHARVSTMQTGNPHKMRVAFTLRLEDRRDAKDLERFVHEFLAPFRRHGEWFACSLEMARSAVARGALPPDHWFAEAPT